MLESPHNLRDSTEMTADPFSDILKFTNAETAVTGGFTAGGSWAIRFPAPEKIKFFALVKGNCWLCIDGQEGHLRVEEGDVFLYSAQRSFVLAGDLATVPLDAKTLFTGTVNRTAKIGDTEDCIQIRGHVLLDPVSGGLLADVLPPLIHVKAASPQSTVLRWLLEQLIRERAAELLGIQSRVGAARPAHLPTDFARPSGNVRPLGYRMASRGRRQTARSRAAADAWRAGPSVAARRAGKSRRHVEDHLRPDLQRGRRCFPAGLSDEVADASC